MKIVIIGGLNIDILAKAQKDIENGTSNIAEITVVPGGVGRNIAENLINMGAEVTLVTAAGDDFFGDFIKASFDGTGIDCRLIKKNKTGIYLASMKKDGSLDKSFCDMSGVENISFEDIKNLKIDFREYDGAIVDANLNSAAITKLCEHFRKIGLRYALESVSNQKAERIKGAINGCTLIKPNKYEAEAISGMSCKNLEEAIRCAYAINSMGAENILISLGSEGFYYSSNDYIGHFDVEKNEVIDVTGAGDALITAAFMSILYGFKGQRTCEIARHCAMLTCKSNYSVSKEITPDIFKFEDEDEDIKE